MPPPRQSDRQFDVVVVGAGAAGLMCAAAAGQRGRRVALLEHNAQPGRKILISGGGRCNFTNIHCTPANFLSENPHFAKSPLALYQPQHFLELVDRYCIPWHEKTLGQLFCDHSARAILDMLLAECALGKVDLVLNARNVTVERTTASFRISSSQGEFQSDALVVASGGLSIPKLGATGLAYDLARQFQLEIVPPRPALVPLILAGKEARWTALAGVSTEIEAWAASKATSRSTHPRFREKMLVTHRGLSGPAILQASSYWRPGQPVFVDLAPGRAAGSLLAPLLEPGAVRNPAALKQALHAILPQRLATFLAESSAPANWHNPALAELERGFRTFAFHPAGTEGFQKAEVTAGGIHTGGLNARTLETRAISGLFFIGEAVDVTGHLGGFNFQWAWASAVAAARAL
jgi:predicted Rossmann fold flavoprotein